MKQRFKFIALLVVALVSMNSAKAQSLKDIFGGGSIMDVIEDVASDYIDFSIVGSWQYEGSAVELTSDSKLAEVGSSLASGTAEAKVDEYLAKVGIKPGAMGFTFTNDGNMSVTLAGRTFDGTYTYNAETSELEMKISKIPVKAEVKVLASSFAILFKTDALLNFVKTISSKSSNSTISSLSSTLSAYEGMKAGFSFEK